MAGGMKWVGLVPVGGQSNGGADCLQSPPVKDIVRITGLNEMRIKFVRLRPHFFLTFSYIFFVFSFCFWMFVRVFALQTKSMANIWLIVNVKEGFNSGSSDRIYTNVLHKMNNGESIKTVDQHLISILGWDFWENV